MADGAQQFTDPLVRDQIFPEPHQVFSFKPCGLAEVLPDCRVVVDTNVLVTPYVTVHASLARIREVFERLTKSGQLRVPGQVAREFADIRAEKLKTLFSQLSKRRDFDFKKSQYPLLYFVACLAGSLFSLFHLLNC